ncbi:MAG TPA: TMEM165/GDT1 family protein [Streptosporangiaceae bacterium]|jgi:putative Ca2+/H+ antiporter (TMEM165/GDT1 family)|nr:TMEM165/GDT1 family protein [Streptosporangiaceae bacterium]
MSLAVLGTVYPLIFISELPDKTMFASLVLATRGRALAVWTGAALAFAVHVCIAVTVGAALFTWLPERTVQALAAALFLAGAVLAFRGSFAGLSAAKPATDESALSEQSTESAAAGPAADAADSAGSAGAARITPDPATVAPQDSASRVFVTTFVVVFLAEWGDLTQILTASLAARFHAPVAVGVSAGLALWTVAALAVLASRPLRRLPAGLVRRLTGIVLLVLAAFAAVAAATGP